MTHECRICSGSARKRCAGCGKVWYCSEKCQRSHWKSHIFDCKRDPSRPILTAYHLYRAVFKDEFPRDPDTRRDYGFDNAHTRKDRTMLFGLYIGLIKFREVEPIDLHRWRHNGIIAQEIIKVSEKESGMTKGEYYPWFLQNQYLLDPSWKPSYNREESLILQTWTYIGGNPSHTYQQHKTAYDAWNTETQDCFLFYHLIHSDSYPSPDQDSWVTFGFAASGDETNLAWAYKGLILKEMCPFDEFTSSFKAGSMVTLFQRYGFELQILRMSRLRDFFEDIGVKSVWYLKAYVYMKQEPEQLVACLGAHYGIHNSAEAVAHFQLLKNTYKEVLEHPKGDPLELHEACVTGRTFAYVDGILTIKKDAEVLRRLMKNPFPLSDIGV